MVNNVDMSNRGPLMAAPTSVRLYDSDMDSIQKEAARMGIPVGILIRMIIANHVDQKTRPGKR